MTRTLTKELHSNPIRHVAVVGAALRGRPPSASNEFFGVCDLRLVVSKGILGVCDLNHLVSKERGAATECRPYFAMDMVS